MGSKPVLDQSGMIHSQLGSLHIMERHNEGEKTGIPTC